MFCRERSQQSIDRDARKQTKFTQARSIAVFYVRLDPTRQGLLGETPGLLGRNRLMQNSNFVTMFTPIALRCVHWRE
jgi:hypothetical protein